MIPCGLPVNPLPPPAVASTRASSHTDATHHDASARWTVSESLLRGYNHLPRIPATGTRKLKAEARFERDIWGMKDWPKQCGYQKEKSL